MHSHNFIHRDIKTENFCIGLGKKSSTVFLIDFGLSKRFRCPKSGKHISYKSKERPIGTISFSSAEATRCMEISRRDDLEAIGYIAIYLAKGGDLPWSGYELVDDDDKATLKKIQHAKELSSEKICAGLPKCFQVYLDIVKELKFDEDPDYTELL